MNGRMIRWCTLAVLTLLGTMIFGCSKPADDAASPSSTASVDASASPAAGAAPAAPAQAPPDISKNMSNPNVPAGVKEQMKSYSQPHSSGAGQ